MTSSLIYLFNLYENITSFLTISYIAVIIALAVVGIISLVNYFVEGQIAQEKSIPKLKKMITILAVSFGILTIPALFLPTPKTVAMMYGVQKINEMNVNANTSATQLYKDITTII
ncbi:MAG: hypothetical protein J6S85_08025, partial [Methanobrevibacter sp.]|nr:hypothetical protein [Methanobrevibacter sp.]